MNRPAKIALITGGSIVGLAVALLIAGIIVAQTQWFRNAVREKIVSAVEDSTGGRAEIGSFAFEWTKLRAVVRDFTLHGRESPPTPPLFHANLLEVGLNLTSPLRGGINIGYLLVDTPRANIVSYPDGSTNIPEPKVKKQSGGNGLQTVVDLKVGRFDLRNGTAAFADRGAQFDATGRNLHAQLVYDDTPAHYTGELDINPLILKSGDNPGVDVDVKLPVRLYGNRIVLADGVLSTDGSRVAIDGQLENLANPEISAQIDARVALEEMKRAAGLTIPLDTAHAPGMLVAVIDASMGTGKINVKSARVRLGESRIDADGVLQQPDRAGSMAFQADLALGELGRLFNVSVQPQGTLRAGGVAGLESGGGYSVRANIEGRNVGFQSNGTRITGVSLDSALDANQRRIELSGVRVAGLGGEITGSGAIEDMDRYRFAGDLRHFNLDRLMAAFSSKQLGYSGVASGPVEIAGSLDNRNALFARANLTIAPGTNGVPLSGRLNATYDAANGIVRIEPSYLQLPHTRAEISGSLGRQIQVRLASRDLSDFRPVAPSLPITLSPGGEATVNATVTGSLNDPRVNGAVALTNFEAQGRRFSGLQATLSASKSGASVTNALLRNGLQAQFSGSVGLRDWKPADDQPLNVNVTVRNGDLADILALAGQKPIATGQLTADAHITGTVGDPRGTADVAISNGTIEGQPFDAAGADVAMTETSIDLTNLRFTSGSSRLEGNAQYKHAAGNLKNGSLAAHIDSKQMQLADFQKLIEGVPGLGGTVDVEGNVAATVQPGANGPRVQLTSVNANIAGRGVQAKSQQVGNFTVTARTSGQTVNYNVRSNLAGSTILVNGQSGLFGDHPTAAEIHIANLPVGGALALAGQGDLPVSGTLNADAKVSGTIDDPRVGGSVAVTGGSLYQEKFDRLHATVQYSNRLIEIPSLQFVDGPSRLTLSASLAHAPGDLRNGQLRFNVKGDNLHLAQFERLQLAKAGLAGIVSVEAGGAATLRNSQPPLISTLNANVDSNDLSVDGRPLGGFHLSAETRGRDLDFRLTSNLTGAEIDGSGRMQLAAGYPLNAKLKFSNVTYAGIGAWTGKPAPAGFAASAAGEATVSGPVTKLDNLQAAVRLTTLEAHSVARGFAERPRAPFQIRNQGDIVIALDRSVVTVRNFRVAGSGMNIAISGTAPLQPNGSVKLTADMTAQLNALEAFSPDIFASGAVTLKAAVTGPISDPAVNGQLQLQKASFNTLNLPNGIANANGSVVFTGKEAVIQGVTGESGGGKVTLSGTVAYGGPVMQARVQAAVDRVSVNYPSNVVSQVSAKLQLAGNSARSLVSGNVSIHRVGLLSQSDVGSILTQVATPPSEPTPRTGFLAGMHFDVNIATAPDFRLETSLTENLQAEANLTLRGTVDQLGMLGRIQVTRGELVFFGYKYEVDRGSITFNNPQDINPLVNLDLSTTAQGVNVVITVSGEMDRLKLSYRSDPPMQFSDLVSLLAAGKNPTTDPVLAARQPVAPEQTFQQRGASTLLGQAVANPISGRLQRLFGVSQLKINPQITGESNTPQATMTLQQQITPDLTFTYIQDVTQSNPQAIRVEWSVNSQWSAIAQRDTYGMFDLDLFYKKRFR